MSTFLIYAAFVTYLSGFIAYQCEPSSFEDFLMKFKVTLSILVAISFWTLFAL